MNASRTRISLIGVALPVAALSLVHPTAGQDLPDARPEDVGVSSKKVAELSAFMEGLVKKGKIAGGVTMMARHGKVVHLESVGMADREAEKPMTTDAIFRIASMTKPITSVAVMMLWEEGKLGLDDPVSDYIPEFKSPAILLSVDPWETKPAKSEITIRHLLTHTSGIGYEFTEPIGPVYKKHGMHCGDCPTDMTLQHMIETLASLPLLFEPGERFEYGMSMDVLGRVVEVTSGLSLDQFFNEKIFLPLGMNDTFFKVPTEKLPRLAAPYMPQGHSIRKLQKGEAVDWPFGAGTYKITADGVYGEPNEFIPGGSSLCSTTVDYMRFCQMILNGGELDGIRLLRNDTVKTITAGQLGGRIGELGDYGFGFGVMPDSADVHEQLRSSCHWAGGWSTSFHISPRGDWALVAMTQLAWSDATPQWFTNYRKLAADSIID